MYFKLTGVMLTLGTVELSHFLAVRWPWELGTCVLSSGSRSTPCFDVCLAHIFSAITTFWLLGRHAMDAVNSALQSDDYAATRRALHSPALQLSAMLQQDADRFYHDELRCMRQEKQVCISASVLDCLCLCLCPSVCLSVIPYVCLSSVRLSVLLSHISIKATWAPGIQMGSGNWLISVVNLMKCHQGIKISLCCWVLLWYFSVNLVWSGLVVWSYFVSCFQSDIDKPCFCGLYEL